MFLLGTFSEKRQNIYNNVGKPTPFLVWDVIFGLLIFSLISGIRWNVGVDHLAYLNNYLIQQKIGAFLFEKEPGFEFITQTFASTGIHFTIYFAFLAFLQIFFFYKSFSNERYLYPFIGIAIIFGPHFLSWMNGIRQMIVATVFVYAVQFIKERNIVKYAVTILLASLMHQSALILLPFYFIPDYDYFRNRWFTFSLVGACLYLGNNNFWIDSLKNLSGILQLIGYDRYDERLDYWIEDEMVRNFGPRRISLILLSVATIWLSPKLKKRFEGTYFLTYYNFAIIGFLLFNLLGNTSHIFLRPISYLTIFSAVTTAYLLAYLKERTTSKNFLLYIIILLLSISYLPISIVAEHGKGEKDFANYKFYWDYKER